MTKPPKRGELIRVQPQKVVAIVKGSDSFDFKLEI